METGGQAVQGKTEFRDSNLKADSVASGFAIPTLPRELDLRLLSPIYDRILDLGRPRYSFSDLNLVENKRPAFL